MTKSIIVAIGREREIGSKGVIPWDLPEDRKEFRRVTTGHPVIMGRKTYDSIISFLGKPLPNRTNIVVTSDQNLEAPECVIVHSIEEALSITSPNEEVFIIGGATIYKQAISFVDKLYVTEIDETYPSADVFFPVINVNDWGLVQKNPMPTTPNCPTATFVVYERKK